jgi:hypothetical protein
MGQQGINADINCHYYLLGIRFVKKNGEESPRQYMILPSSGHGVYDLDAVFGEQGKEKLHLTFSAFSIGVIINW